MNTATIKTPARKPAKNSDAFLAYLAGTRCSVPQVAWVDRKAVKDARVNFVGLKGSGITFVTDF